MTIVDQFHLSGAWNFRDLGGLRTDDGKEVRRGVLFRSSELCALDTDGQRRLGELSISDVIDLRSQNEIAWNGADALPHGVTSHVVSVHEDNTQAAPHEPQELTPQLAEAALEYAYSQFPIMPSSQRALAYVIQFVDDADGGVLIHCAAGKDRAGWITAALLRAAGVSETEIMLDYLRSNDAVEPLRQHVISRNGDLSLISDKVLGVHHDFMAAAWRAVDEKYGSFPAYLEHIGIDEEHVAILRAHLIG